MPPIRDYICTTTECPENTGHFSAGMAAVFEMFVGINEEPECIACGSKLTQVINSAPRGYVKGSTNPVKQ